MRLLALATTALTLLAGTALARNSWEGHTIITAVNSTCVADGETVGRTLFSTYMPAGISDNGADSHITFYGTRNAHSLKVAGALAGGKNYNSIYINSYGKAGVQPQPAGQISAYTATVSPAPLSTTTEYINMTITITNWSTTPGCTATLRGSYVRRR